MTELKGGRWYTRQDGTTDGPFAAGLVTRYILIGRLEMDDLVSEDKEIWCKVREVSGLIPDAMKGDPDDPMYEERLMAARRWADERFAEDRRANEPEGYIDERRTGDERRDFEYNEIMEHRSLLRSRRQGRSTTSSIISGLFLTAMIGAIAAAGYYAYLNQPEEVVIDCGAPPVAGVNWMNCALQGRDYNSAMLNDAIIRNARMNAANLQSAKLQNADLAYTDMSLAQLQGADLTGADLRGANLTGANMEGALVMNADLSFANLTGTRLVGANFSGVKLNKAIWVDGRTCPDNAVGSC